VGAGGLGVPAGCEVRAALDLAGLDVLALDEAATLDEGTTPDELAPAALDGPATVRSARGWLEPQPASTTVTMAAAAIARTRCMSAHPTTR
jgi:hypothetical protein